MQQSARVAVLEGLERLVDDELLVHRLQDVRAEDRVQVRLHEIEDQVDIPVVFSLWVDTMQRYTKNWHPSLENQILILQLLIK